MPGLTWIVLGFAAVGLWTVARGAWRVVFGTRRDRGAVSLELRRDYALEACRSGWDGPTWRPERYKAEFARQNGLSS